MHAKRLTTPDIRMRKGTVPIVCLTAYTAPFSKILDKHADILLVGDSVGMVLYGMESTLSVTLEMMAAHGKAVVRASEHACVVIDMPFGSYQENPAQAFRNAALLLSETGCNAVKLEGGAAIAETIAFLVERGIPVMGHVGLTPQSVNGLGGYRTQGKTATDRKRILRDAKAVTKAGAFSIVLEGMVETLAADITKAVAIPTIGIGASHQCDGQVLVTEDMVGLFTDFTPKFVKRYAEIAASLDDAAARFATEVRTRKFPEKKHCFAAQE